MKYEVVIGDRTLVVEVGANGRFLVDGKVVAGEVLSQDGGRSFIATVESRPHEVHRLRRSPMRLQVDGVEVDVTVSDARQIAARRVGGAVAHARTELRAPMAGLVKGVHVAEGDVVESGAPLVTLEAMKMENELRAPVPGRVTRVAMPSGTKVDAGALLVVIEPEAK